MKISSDKKIPDKKWVVCDLDGTLTSTKAPMDTEMAGLMGDLLAAKRVAVIGGGKYALFREQLLRPLQTPRSLLARLFLFPTTATSFYRYQNGWKNIYAHPLSKQEREKIKKTIREVLKEIQYQPPKKIYGVMIEDRGTQITFSALGQDVVKIIGKKRGVALKEKWARAHGKTKMKIARILAAKLPQFEVRAAGYTSVDVTRKGIDKGYGIRQIMKHVGAKIKDMLFLGDAIFPGGNDYAVVRTGVDYIPVKGPEDTKRIIRAILNKK